MVDGKETPEILEEMKLIYRCDPVMGTLRYISDRGSARRGDLVGAYHKSSGYIRVRFDREDFWAHRIIWAFANGEWPPEEIDHINHAKTDNRIENLRPATRAENAKNLRVNKNNKSGVSGVRWIENKKCWRARIGGPKSKGRDLGYYGNLFDAVCARRSAEIARGYHPNHGTT